MEQQYQKACSSWSQRSCFLFLVKKACFLYDLCRQGSTNRITLPSDRLRRLVRTAIVSSARLRCLEAGQWLCTEEAPEALILLLQHACLTPGLAKQGPITSESSWQLQAAAPVEMSQPCCLSMHRLPHALCPPLEEAGPWGPCSRKIQDQKAGAGHNPANQKSPRSALETNQQKHYIRGSESQCTVFSFHMKAASSWRYNKRGPLLHTAYIMALTFKPGQMICEFHVFPEMGIAVKRKQNY